MKSNIQKIFNIKAKNPVYFIAEIGVNHNGNIKLAKKMIDAAKNSGANAVKFQTFKAETLVTPSTKKVEYQKNTTPSKVSHFDMIKSLELNEEKHKAKHLPLSDPERVYALRFLIREKIQTL